MATMTAHAAQRAAERLATLPNDVATQCIALATEYADTHTDGDHAVRVAKLARAVGEAWGAASNGDTVWAIVRQGAVQTYMFRRSTQPLDRAAFNVRTVHLAA